MKNHILKRLNYLLIAISSLMLSASFYFQYVLEMQPCPLCLMQRLCVFLIWCFCVIALLIRSKKGLSFVYFFQSIISLSGLYFAGRQMWLMSLPADKVPACMPGLDVLMEYFPWQTVVKTLLWGAGDCAEATWSMLGIAMPGWCALYFIFMAIISIFLYKDNWQLTQ